MIAPKFIKRRISNYYKRKNKGNIPLDYKLLNKYNNVIDMINDFSCVPSNVVLKLDMQLFDFSNIKDLTLK